MMLAQLDNRLALLVGGSRDSPLRHQSMRATLDWSYQLLSPAAQTLFARLGTFAGSWTLEAATAVVSDEELEPTSLLALHEALVDTSMIQIVSQPVGELRFNMLEILREYACMQLRDRPEVQVLRQRYMKYFLELARRGAGALRTEEAREWMDRLDADYNNLRLVLEWSQSTGELEIGLELAGALHEFWIMRERRHEVYVWLREQLRLPYAGALTEVRGKALLTAAAIAASYGDGVSAEGFAAESLILAEQRDIQSLRAWALLQIGENASNAGEFVKGLALLEDSLREFERLGDLHGKARVLHAIGYCYRDRPPAEQYYRGSLALAREVGNESISAGAVTKLGELSAEYGQFDLAEAQIREGLALARKLGHVHQTTIAQYSLAKLMLARGDWEQAEELYIASYELALRQDAIGIAVLSLGGLGRIAFWRGDPQGARQHHLACLRLLGDRFPTFRPRFIAMLGKLAEATGDLVQAATYHKESLRLYHAIEDQIGVAWAQSNLGRLELEAGSIEACAALLGASLESLLQTGGENYSRKYPAAISCLSNVAELAEQQGEAARAALLWGAIEVLQECHPPNPLLYESQPGDALRIREARVRLAEGAHLSHWTDGRTLSFDETLHHALYVVWSLAGRG
ncbi:MAG: hypothetical protein RLZZ387_3568 [Chloroflexota bacterium]|jgi:hypothetical protein